MLSLLIVLCLIGQSSAAAIIPRLAGCKITIRQHLSNPQPVLVLQNNAISHIDAIVLPEDVNGTITFRSGDQIDVACPGGEVKLYGTTINEDTVPISCFFGTIFKVNEKFVPFQNITCSVTPKSTARLSGKECSVNYKEIEIGFQIKERFINHIWTCYDEKLQHSLYAVTYLVHNIAGKQTRVPRPRFKEANFYYTDQKVDRLYSRKVQTETINNILGLKHNGSSIIHPTGNIFLSTGHYAPKADFVFGSQQRLTFYYVNAAPQWQNLNGGNWNTMEENTRKLAAQRKVDLIVFTGGHGVMTHPDVSGVDQQLFLWVGKNGEHGIPVPAFYYKVIYEPISEKGIALVGRNNPHKEVDKSDYICQDVCDSVKWLTWKQSNVTLGLVYCCEVDDFRRSVTVLPKFTVKSLLA
ncbi:uncharacterized protein LOC116164022 [Photinus pyralis]|uniref:uncharacterized protein LOC116164022 n=1 Tax=Photinus pyralis TaxID=7054 RepID=UPI0012673DBF|nr:uncharacterized protein LOC116164022 [Photinus pyralis]